MFEKINSNDFIDGPVFFESKVRSLIGRLEINLI